MRKSSYPSLRVVNHHAGKPIDVAWNTYWMLDAGFLVLFLVEAIISKSRFDWLIGGWRGHMILTVVMLVLFLVRSIWKRTKETFYFAPPRPVGVVLAIACAWAVICCIVQPNAYANLAFLAAFAANIYVCLFIAPNLVLPYLGERAILLYALPIFAANVLNLAFSIVDPTIGLPEARLAGISDNATHSGALGAMAAIVALWMVLEWSRRRPVWLALWAVCVVTLLMTRTRASIGGWAVGSVAMIGYWSRWQQAAYFKWYVALSVVTLLMLMGLAAIARPELISRSREHLRANDREELFGSRMTYWELGIVHAAKYPLFGEGPMARFSNTNDPTNVDAYDVDRVYCSTWLAFAQAYGIPGALLFALACLKIVLSAIKGQVALPLLLVGLMFSCVVSSIGHMWVVSFGTPSDRATWLIIGLALAARPSQDRGKLFVTEYRKANVGRL